MWVAFAGFLSVLSSFAQKQTAYELLLCVGVLSLTSVKNLAYVSQIAGLNPSAMSRQAGSLTAGRVVPLAVACGGSRAVARVRARLRWLA